MALTQAPGRPPGTFLNYPLELDLDNLQADVAILGIPYGLPYRPDEMANDQSRAPDAIRQLSHHPAYTRNHYDWDLGGPLLDGRPIKVVDVGDVPGNPNDINEHYRNAEKVITTLLTRNVMPIVLGGDHGVPIPVLRGFKQWAPITLVHVDAHLDWRDQVNGVQDGLSSPIRRASEMDHIGEIFQIGLRSAGSARPEEMEAAISYGSHLIPDIELQQIGMRSVLDRIPDQSNYYLTIDADGVDPTIMPAVAGPAPGGVTYDQMRTLIHGLVDKGRVVGMDIVEITPKRDLNGITAITAGRFICNLIGKAVRAGYFQDR